jgi:nitrous oxidase accessory protein NosD
MQHNTMLKHFTHTCLLAIILVFCACENDNLIAPTEQPDQEYTQRHAELETMMETELAEIESEVALSPRSVVTLPAGSVDGLAAAIADAGPGGTVNVASGPHIESGTVTINFPIRLMGEDGAVLIFDTDPLSIAGTIVPALHVLDAPRSIISNLEIRPANAVGGTGILLENSDRSIVIRNKTFDQENGVLVQYSDRVYLVGNDFHSSPLWLSGEIASSFGVIVINGKNARLYNNKYSDGFCGVWTCDRNGVLAGNLLKENLYGLIICKVPEAFNYVLPSGETAFADLTGTRWSVFNNDANGNFDTGYLIIDGADRNFLIGNRASNNVRLEYDFAGETSRFGLLTPPSVRNIGFIPSGDRVLDCGDRNRIFGGDQVDASGAGVCF